MEPGDFASSLDGAVEPSLGSDASTGVPDSATPLRNARAEAGARRDAAASAITRADAGLRDAACTWGLVQADQHPLAGNTPSAIGTADFDGDGHLDLAIAGHGIDDTTNTSDVAILLGKGDGTFQTAVMYATGRDSYALAVGDLNNDGIPDLAVANVANGLSILLGNGDGTFATAMQYASEAEAEGVAVADVNGDGALDVAPGVHRDSDRRSRCRRAECPLSTLRTLATFRRRCPEVRRRRCSFPSFHDAMREELAH